MDNAGKPLLVSPKDLKIALEKERVVLVDTRAPDSFLKEHIANANNIHECFTFLAMSDEKGMKDLENKFVDLFGKAGITGHDEWVVCYEEGMASGFAQSCRAFYLLKWLGHPKVSVLDGGLVAWKKEGLSVTSDPSNPVATNFKTNIQKHLIVTQDEVLEAIQKKKILLDVRDKDEWIGESSSPYGKDFAPRKGRLEGAKWIEWYNLMEKKDGVAFCREDNEVVKSLAEKGVNPNDEVIIYCFKGSRASNTLLLLYKAGFTNVKNYFASWNEWSRNDKLPIDDKKLSA